MPTWNHSENMGDDYKQNTGKSANQNLGFSLAQEGFTCIKLLIVKSCFYIDSSIIVSAHSGLN